MSIMFLHILYLTAITAEAMTAALAAGRRRMDWVGVCLLGCVTALKVCLIALLSALFLMYVGTAAWSQQSFFEQDQKPPAERRPEGAGEDKGNPEVAQQRAQASPTGIYTVLSGDDKRSANKTEAEGASEQSDWWERFWYDIKVTDVAIALFTGLLFISTVFLWLSTRKAAAAARASADALAAVERAYLFPSPEVYVLRSEEPGGTGIDRARYKLHVTNIGATPGYVTRVFMDFAEHVPTGKPVYRDRGSQLNVLVGRGETTLVGLGNPKSPIPMVWESNYCPRHTQWAFGFIEYQDVFKVRTRTTRFCYVINPESTVDATKMQVSGPPG